MLVQKAAKGLLHKHFRQAVALGKQWRCKVVEACVWTKNGIATRIAKSEPMRLGQSSFPFLFHTQDKKYDIEIRSFCIADSFE
jgi:hypothetical protein